MILRPDENSVSWKAGALSAGVHGVLLLGLLISFNWKAAHPVLQVTEVELWDKLPTKPQAVEVKPEPQPAPQETPKLEPKPEPQPVSKAEEHAKVDIALENKKKALEEKHKKEEIAKQARKLLEEEELRDKKAAEKRQQDELDKIKRELLAEDHAASEAKASSAKSAANASAVAEFTDKIKSKIRANVNKAACGDGNPELKFEIGLLPTGELNGRPKLARSSGISACDDAVERAIIASEPLPLPSDSNLFLQFRNLTLKFRPNE